MLAMLAKMAAPSPGGDGLISGEILIRPVSMLHRMSHHPGWLANVGLVTPAMNPGTRSSSSTLDRSVYGNAWRVNPRNTPPDASAHAANTWSATSPEGFR